MNSSTTGALEISHNFLHQSTSKIPLSETSNPPSLEFPNTHFMETTTRPPKRPLSLTTPMTQQDSKRTINSTHKPQKPLTLTPGQVCLRLLIKTKSISGIIGKSGECIKLIQSHTNTKIQVENPPNPKTEERVVVILGFPTPKKVADGPLGDLGEVSPVQEAVMRVYERSLEVEVECGGVAVGDGGAVGCRLMADTSQIGIVMGKGGKRIEKFRKETGASIKIVSNDQLPACVGPNDEVFQINGDVLAVKKALLAISQFLQDFPPSDKSQLGSKPVLPESYPNQRVEHVPLPNSFMGNRSVPHEIYPNQRAERLPVQNSTFGSKPFLSGTYPNPRAEPLRHQIATYGNRPVPYESYPDPRAEALRRQISTYGSKQVPYETYPDPHIAPLTHFVPPPTKPPQVGVSFDYTSRGPVATENVKNPAADSDKDKQEVAFRLLCHTERIGGVIGKGGAIIRKLQNDTGAVLSVGAPVEEADERVITVSASENLDDVYSIAQNAVLRVFQRSLEVGIAKGLDSGSKKGTVTARLLILPNQVGCIMGKGGSVISEIRKITGTGIVVLNGDKIPKCASENDQMVQIVGESANVQDALLHITSKLRDNLSPNKSQNKVRVRSNLPSTYPETNPFERQKEQPTSGLYLQSGLSRNINEVVGSTHSMGHIGLSHNFDRPISPRPWTSQSIAGTNLRGVSDISRGGTVPKGGIELGSGSKSAIVTNTSVEIMVPEDAIRSVYGEGGHNLTRIRQISGAKVTVHEPYPGSTDTAVVISGTPDQTQAAQSLLHAFIISG